MSEANKTQVAGTHYRSDYQHWDFVCDTKMHYLLGCASKYLTRWREKNGVEDLKKSRHYYQKAKEMNIKSWQNDTVAAMYNRFIMSNSMGQSEASVMKFAAAGLYDDAIESLSALIRDYE